MCDWLAMACQVKALALESRIEAVLKAERQAQAAGGSAGGARLAELRQRERELEQRVRTANHALGIAQQPAPRRGYRGSGGGTGSVASMRAGVTTDSSTAEAIVSISWGGTGCGCAGCDARVSVLPPHQLAKQTAERELGRVVTEIKSIIAANKHRKVNGSS